MSGFYRETYVKRTRRNRWCKWCYERINKGDPSVVIANKSGSDFCSARYHPECNEALGRYVRVNRAWDEELPDYAMNRGGIKLRGEPEEPVVPIKKMPLYKSTIVIWSEFAPAKLELSALAREAETGEAYCAKREAVLVEDPSGDADWDGTEFFNATDELQL